MSDVLSSLFLTEKIKGDFQLDIKTLKMQMCFVAYACLRDKTVWDSAVMAEIFPPCLIRCINRYHDMGDRPLLEDDFEMYITLLVWQETYHDKQILQKIICMSQDFLPDYTQEIMECLYQQRLFQEVLWLFEQGSLLSDKIFGQKILYLIAKSAYYCSEFEIAKKYFLLAREQGCLDKQLASYLQWIEGKLQPARRE